MHDEFTRAAKPFDSNDLTFFICIEVIALCFNLSLYKLVCCNLASL